MKKRNIFLIIIILIILLTSCSFTNRPPSLDEIGDKTITVGKILSFNTHASDPDGDILFISVSPEKFEECFDSERDIFEWQPSQEDIGKYQVTFRVNDGQASAGETINITVGSINNLPLVNVIADQVIREGEQLGPLTLNATDEDNDQLIWEILSGPGEIINDNQYVWQTTHSDSGEHQIMVQVLDGNGGSAMSTFGVTVTNTNRLPQIVGIADQVIDEGEELGPLTLEAIDEDNDQLTWEIVSGPGEIINNNLYYWNVTYSDSGEHGVILKVSDNGGGSDVLSFKVTVNNINRLPHLQLRDKDDNLFTDTIIFTIGQNNEIYIEALDSDSDFLNYMLADWYTNNGNDLLDFGTHFSVDKESAKGIFSWAPLSGDEGEYSVTFKVTDNNGGSDIESIVIKVQP